MNWSSNGTHAKTDGMLMQAENLATAVKEEVVHAGVAVKDEVKHAGEFVAAKANSAVASVGGTMSDIAGSIKQHTPASIAPYTEKATAGLQHAGEYLERGDIGGIIDDLSGIIKRHPMSAMLTGVAIGFVIARNMRR